MIGNMIKFKDDVEELLKSYKETVREIRALELEIATVENEYQGCGALQYSERTGITYKITSPVENEVLSKEKRIQFLKYLKRNKELRIKKIENLISCLDEVEYEIITSYYFRGMNMESIAERLGMNPKYLICKKSKIIKKIELDMMNLKSLTNF
ncbi:hypothetical protein P5E70_04495 [Clostridium perfringens]|uniref:hypothetical protein n=1 Tax=Clostridium perfringens TaxID=1502 RepID=UPI0024BC2E13|nr:hypothetical protein [Clostridium perfringens]MDK0737897.1 hypothetical protein [Clostridium perfringens]CAJ1763916.1 transcriptional regulator [uncultured phage]CAJ1889285.1 transcriptional regulator [uncultured phage]